MDSDSAARSSSPSVFVVEDTAVHLKVPPRLPARAIRREAMRVSIGCAERVGVPGLRAWLAPAPKVEAFEKRIVLPAPKRLRRPVPRKRVLVVDDEPIMRELVGYMLEQEFEVISLESARVALEQMRDGARFDIVLSDLMMPELSGMDLFRALECEHPEMAERMIFMTGGTFTEPMGSFLSQLGADPLLKPFGRDDILARIAVQLAHLSQ